MSILNKVNISGELQNWWNGLTTRINLIKGILYLPEDYDADKEYPVLVQFYETHSGGLNVYHAPMLSSAIGRCNILCK